MNRPPDDEYGSLQDLLGDSPYDDSGDDFGAGDTADDPGSGEDPAGDTADDPASGEDPAGDPGSGEDPAGDAASHLADTSREPTDDLAVDPAGSDLWRGLPAGMQAEYAEAFRRGYERARRGEDLTEPSGEEPTQEIRLPERVAPDPQVSPEPVEPEQAPVEPTRRIDRSALAGIGQPDAMPPTSSPRTNPPPSSPADPLPDTGSPYAESFQEPPRTGTVQALLAKLLGPDEDRDPRLLAAALAVVALVVVLAAFGIGRLFAEDGSGSEADTQGQVSGEPGSRQQSPYQGAVHPVPVAAATATCQTGSSVDSAGNPVTYEPAKAHDANLSTAWRCDGSGRGQRLTLTLPRKTVVAQVGLVPGYAKTDPVSGVDRYAENNRITKVRWRFDDGSTFVQRMSGNAVNRSMRLMRLPETSTRRVVLEILASTAGTRNTVAISELRVAAPRG
ncbi:MAG TPA: hypothetical protein VF165_17285 [Nocardioidaceae bacterium]